MTEEAQVKSVALFYFYGLLDEVLAKQASVCTLNMCRRRIKNDQFSEERIPAVIVYCTNTYWEKVKKKQKRGQSSISYEAGWIVPQNMDIGLWKQFQKETEADEFLSIIWSQILRFSDEEISEGLGVTVGTVRHRVGRGLRILGSMKKMDS